MTLKPEDRALIERTRPVPDYSDLKACAQMARFWSIEEAHLAALLDAARSAGPVSSGEGERDREAAAKALFRRAQGVYREDHDHFPMRNTWESATEQVREGWRSMVDAVFEAAKPDHAAHRADLHHETEALINEFAVALADKLAEAERKYGYSDEWAAGDWEDECRARFMEHIAKGDPRDVAAYCAFMWRHGWSTAPNPSDEVAPHGWVYLDDDGWEYNPDPQHPHQRGENLHATDFRPATPEEATDSTLFRPGVVEYEFCRDNPVTPTPPPALLEALRDLRSHAVVLLQNSEGCAVNHYGEDFSLFGMPGWLADARAAVERATTALQPFADRLPTEEGA